MNRFILIAVVMAGFFSLALTPLERQLAQHAYDELKLGRENTREAAVKIQEAQTERDHARDFATGVAGSLGTLKADVEAARLREVALVTRVNELQVEHDRVHSYWGIGAITLGISILAKHLFIAAAVIAVLALVLWVVSMTPWGAFVKVGLSAVTGFVRMVGAVIGSIFRKIKERLQKK